jgi:hypothetical protein
MHMAAATLPFTCPDGYLSGGEAFEQACAVLIPDHDELVRRIHEPLTVKSHHADELAPADAAEVVRGIAVRRIAAVTDADVGLCRAKAKPPSKYGMPSPATVLREVGRKE